MLRRSWFAIACGLVALAGCAGTPQGYYVPGQARSVLLPRPYQTPGPPGYQTSQPPMPIEGPAPGLPLSTAAPAGRAVALLAPLTGANAERGQALAQAAKLALSAEGSPTLTVLDTQSTPEGAAVAVQQAISGGAGMIIGPLTAAETAATAGPAQAAGVPVLAFTNDPAQSHPGVWTLGLTPTQQVRRVVASLAAQGKTSFAAVLPNDAFGQAMANALTAVLAEASLPPPDIRFHAGTIQSANMVMKEISQYASRRGPLDAQMRAARALHTAEGRKRAAELTREPIPAPPMDALLLADFGDMLHTLVSLLPYYDLDPPRVRVVGPAQWAAPAVVGASELRGAWYAAPDPALRADFDRRYRAVSGDAAPGLADFAYDAASIARALSAAGEGYSLAALCRPEGFAGVNGVLGLQPDGRVRRGLAVFEISRGGASMIEAAPNTLGEPGI